MPEIKDFVSQLGFNPAVGDPVKPVRRVVFRFAALTTNGRINVLGDTESIDIISNNRDQVVAQLANDSHFADSLVTFVEAQVVESHIDEPVEHEDEPA